MASGSQLFEFTLAVIVVVDMLVLILMKAVVVMVRIDDSLSVIEYTMMRTFPG